MPTPNSNALERKKIALILSPRLGDSLLLMSVAHNLSAAEFQVTVFGDFISDLRDWFPHVSIEPALGESDAETRLAEFDGAIQMHRTIPLKNLQEIHAKPIFFDQWIVPDKLDRRHALVQLLDFCRDEFGIQNPSGGNGITANAGLRHRRFSQRVIIHPTASHPAKAWSPERFRKLAQKLGERGLNPVFVMSPAERVEWRWLGDHGLEAKVFASLSELAALLYESGWFIGNDSGIGHLASNLGISTVSIFPRPRTAKRWRPIWAPGCVVAHAWLPTGALRRRFWRYTVTVDRVIRSLEFLMNGSSTPCTNCSSTGLIAPARHTNSTG